MEFGQFRIMHRFYYCITKFCGLINMPRTIKPSRFLLYQMRICGNIYEKTLNME